MSSFELSDRYIRSFVFHFNGKIHANNDGTSVGKKINVQKRKRSEKIKKKKTIS